MGFRNICTNPLISVLKCAILLSLVFRHTRDATYGFRLNDGVLIYFRLNLYLNIRILPMGTCYTYLLYDDWDWSYSNQSKEELTEDLKKELPIAEVISTWNHYIVVDLDKNSPWGDNAQKLKKYCDKAYYCTDTAPYELLKVEFKKTEEDKTIEAAEPANRNAQHIADARADWDQRYRQASLGSRAAVDASHRG